jgi:hypothetical protein
MANELFKKVTDATGLPSELVSNELSQVLSGKGISKDDMTLDDLRLVMADYLREVILHAKDKFEEGVFIEEEIDAADLGAED